MRPARQIGAAAGLLAAALATAACDSQARARKDLARLGVDYSQEALIRRASEGDHRAVRLLLDAGMNPNTDPAKGPTPLMQAAAAGHQQVIEVLLDKGADPNVKRPDGSTALHDAATGGHSATGLALLEKGADPNVTDASQRTPLINAILARKEDLVI